MVAKLLSFITSRNTFFIVSARKNTFRCTFVRFSVFSTITRDPCKRKLLVEFEKTNRIDLLWFIYHISHGRSISSKAFRLLCIWKSRRGTKSMHWKYVLKAVKVRPTQAGHRWELQNSLRKFIVSHLYALFSASWKALIAVAVWKLIMDYHLKLSPVTELGFPQLLKPKLKLIFNSTVLIKVGNWNLKRALYRLE